jgi:predicted glutamine amidotransferase
MCIAIVSTPGMRVMDAALYRGWTANRDGGGIAYVKNGKVVVEKGFLTYNEFHKAYETAFNEVGKESPFLIHMRIGTSGGVTKNNTHPFAIRPQKGPAGAMIHNGILFTPAGAWKGGAGDQKSDTRVVAEALNNILELQDVKEGKELLGQAIGRSNKLAFLYDNKEYVIINEDLGFWDQGIWYSNGGCRVYSNASAR